MATARVVISVKEDRRARMTFGLLAAAVHSAPVGVAHSDQVADSAAAVHPAEVVDAKRTACSLEARLLALC
jgi:hypothetical protein